jgi:hypothetical protein
MDDLYKQLEQQAKKDYKKRPKSANSLGKVKTGKITDESIKRRNKR